MSDEPSRSHTTVPRGKPWADLTDYERGLRDAYSAVAAIVDRDAPDGLVEYGLADDMLCELARLAGV